MYWCEKCGRNHKLTSRIGQDHLKLLPVETTVTGQGDSKELETDINFLTDEEIIKYTPLNQTIPLEPELEEVSPEGNPEQALPSLPEPSPAPDETPVSQGEPQLAQYIPSYDQMTPNEQFIMKQVVMLDGNSKVILERLDQLQNAMYEATQSAEGAAAPGWNFDEFPEWLRKPAIKFLGDIGAAARAFAGDQSASESEQVVRATVTLMEERSKDRIAKKAAQIASAMEDPDVEIYAKKKPPAKPVKDAKKLE